MSNLPKTPSMRLDGKRVLVTGASSGIGLAGAVALAEAGAHVVTVARNKDKLEQAAESMGQSNLTAEPIALDVGDVEATAEFISNQKTFDFVFNAAGMARNHPSLEATTQDFDDVFRINVRGAYFLTRNIAKSAIDSKIPTSILHVSSQMGHVGGMDRTVYCASKHAVEGMIKAFAVEYGKYQIRVNAIAPTFIRTPLTEPTFQRPERVEWILSKIHLGRIGVVEDIMGSVVFFASDASSLITGTSLLIDGGWTAD